METLVAIVFVFAASILLFSLVDLTIAIALYLAYLILVPGLQFSLLGVTLSYNLVNTVLLASFLFRYRVKRPSNIDFRPVMPFLFLHIALLVLTIFQWEIPWSAQFNYWRMSFMKTCFLSLIIWNTLLYEQKAEKYFNTALAIALTIACLYGISLISLNGLNPYTSYLTKYFGIKDTADIYSRSVSRLSFSTAGKIQATMFHPMTWALVLCFSFFLYWDSTFTQKRKLHFVLLGLIVFNLLISGVRTGIAALVISLIYLVAKSGRLKLLVIASISIGIVALIVSLEPTLRNLFLSFIDTTGTKSSIQGSSIQMRMAQFDGALVEIQDNLLIGKGYGWNAYYMSIKGDHPILLAFESLVFVVLCNSGLIGVGIWVTFFFQLFRVNKRMIHKRQQRIVIDSFVVVYLAYAIGTGEYDYVYIFSLFYPILLFQLKKKQSNPITSAYNGIQPTRSSNLLTTVSSNT